MQSLLLVPVDLAEVKAIVQKVTGMTVLEVGKQRRLTPDASGRDPKGSMLRRW